MGPDWDAAEEHLKQTFAAYNDLAFVVNANPLPCAGRRNLSVDLAVQGRRADGRILSRNHGTRMIESVVR